MLRAVAGRSIDASGGIPAGGALIPILAAATMVALRLINVTSMPTGAKAYLAGYYATADGGEGEFIWNAASTGTDNQGTIILPTGQSSGTPGRWIRAKHDNRDIYPVRWYGAKGDNSTNDTTAFAFAITDALTTKPISTAINWVYLSGGTFLTDGFNQNYTDVAFRGAGAEITRWVHRPGNATPLLYWSGGNVSAAAPYGGVTGIQMKAGDSTTPAIFYIDTNIDNQINFDDLALAGTSTNTTQCDGISFNDFLNASWRKFRLDSIGGYGVRIRGSSSSSTSGSSTGVYRSSSALLNAGTGVWTFALVNTAAVPGTALMPFSTGTLPTNAATGLALVSGPAGGVFFAGNCTETSMTIHNTVADALAGTNVITFSDIGSGTHAFATFRANFPVASIDLATDIITFTNNKNIIIATSVAESGRTNTFGTGMTGTGTIVTGGAGALGGLHVVFVYSDGTYPTGLAGGTPYYPIYVTPTTIKLATTVANAVAGTAIDISSSGSGNITLMYTHQVSQLGLGGFSIRELTYDNAGSGTSETINGVACGGLGVLYADYSQFDYKGPMTIEGHRVEINKMIARDTVNGSSTRALFRVEKSNNVVTNQGLQFLLKGLAIDVTVAVATTNGQGSHIRLVGNRGNLDIAPEFDQCRYFGTGCPYDNDKATAFSKVLPQFNGQRGVLDNCKGNQQLNSNPGRLDGQGYSALSGQQITPFLTAELANSFTKPQDLLLSLDNGVAWYKATQTTFGWGRSSGAVSIGATVTGTTTAGAVFTLSATPTGTNFGIGISVSIAGAGAAGVALTGIIQDFDCISATKTFTLGDSTGALVPCLTNVAGAAVTYTAATLGQVGVKYIASAALDFGVILTLTNADLTITAPTGVTFTAGKVVNLGIPSNAPAGIIYNAFVTAGGATVTVRASNITVASINPASGTFTIEVSV